MKVISDALANSIIEALNNIPNKRSVTFKNESSYDLASKLSVELNSKFNTRKFDLEQIELREANGQLENPAIIDDKGTFVCEMLALGNDVNQLEDHEAAVYQKLFVSAPAMKKALQSAYRVLEAISDSLHYEDGLPVTTLEPRQIEIAYLDAVGELSPIAQVLESIEVEVVEG